MGLPEITMRLLDFVTTDPDARSENALDKIENQHIRLVSAIFTEAIRDARLPPGHKESQEARQFLCVDHGKWKASRMAWLLLVLSPREAERTDAAIRRWAADKGLTPAQAVAQGGIICPRTYDGKLSTHYHMYIYAIREGGKLLVPGVMEYLQELGITTSVVTVRSHLRRYGWQHSGLNTYRPPLIYWKEPGDSKVKRRKVKKSSGNGKEAAA